MLENDRYFYANGRRLQNEYANGQVQIFLNEDGSRTTNIRVSDALVKVKRAAIPLPIPDEYGNITVEKGDHGLLLAIKKPILIAPYILVEAKEAVVGGAKGNRFDLALAYALGVSDPELVVDIQDTKLDPKIPDIIAEVIF
jgi:hypothetical protein